MIFGGFRMMEYGMADLWRFRPAETRWEMLGGTESSRSLPTPDNLVSEQAAAVDTRSWPLPRGQASVSMLPDGSGGYLFGGSVQIQQPSLLTDPEAFEGQSTGQHSPFAEHSRLYTRHPHHALIPGDVSDTQIACGCSRLAAV